MHSGRRTGDVPQRLQLERIRGHELNSEKYPPSPPVCRRDIGHGGGHGCILRLLHDQRWGQTGVLPSGGQKGLWVLPSHQEWRQAQSVHGRDQGDA